MCRLFRVIGIFVSVFVPSVSAQSVRLLPVGRIPGDTGSMTGGSGYVIVSAEFIARPPGHVGGFLGWIDQARSLVVYAGVPGDTSRVIIYEFDPHNVQQWAGSQILFVLPFEGGAGGGPRYSIGAASVDRNRLNQLVQSIPAVSGIVTAALTGGGIVKGSALTVAKKVSGISNTDEVKRFIASNFPLDAAHDQVFSIDLASPLSTTGSPAKAVRIFVLGPAGRAADAIGSLPADAHIVPSDAACDESQRVAAPLCIDASTRNYRGNGTYKNLDYLLLRITKLAELPISNALTKPTCLAAADQLNAAARDIAQYPLTFSQRRALDALARIGGDYVAFQNAGQDQYAGAYARYEYDRKAAAPDIVGARSDSALRAWDKCVEIGANNHPSEVQPVALGISVTDSLFGARARGALTAADAYRWYIGLGDAVDALRTARDTSGQAFHELQGARTQARNFIIRNVFVPIVTTAGRPTAAELTRIRRDLADARAKYTQCTECVTQSDAELAQFERTVPVSAVVVAPDAVLGRGVVQVEGDSSVNLEAYLANSSQQPVAGNIEWGISNTDLGRILATLSSKPLTKAAQFIATDQGPRTVSGLITATGQDGIQGAIRVAIHPVVDSIAVRLPMAAVSPSGTFAFQAQPFYHGQPVEHTLIWTSSSSNVLVRGSTIVVSPGTAIDAAHPVTLSARAGAKTRDVVLPIPQPPPSGIF